MAETEHGMLIEKPKKKFLPSEECEKIQRERSEIAKKMKELKQRESHTPAVINDVSDDQRKLA